MEKECADFRESRMNKIAAAVLAAGYALADAEGIARPRGWADERIDDGATIGVLAAGRIPWWKRLCMESPRLFVGAIKIENDDVDVAVYGRAHVGAMVALAARVADEVRLPEDVHLVSEEPKREKRDPGCDCDWGW